MLARRTRIVVSVAVGSALLGIALGLWYLPALPEVVPIHWGVDGEADGFGSPWVLVALGPIFSAVTLLALVAVRLDPFAPLAQPGGGWTAAILCGVCLFGLPLEAVLLHVGAGGAADMAVVVFGMVGALWVLLGVALPHVGRSRTVGIRTPWTLADEGVWASTHRFAGRTFVAGGVSAWLALLVLDGATRSLVVIAALVLASLAPIVWSWWLARAS